MPLPYSEEFFLRKGPCEGAQEPAAGEATRDWLYRGRAATRGRASSLPTFERFLLLLLLVLLIGVDLPDGQLGRLKELFLLKSECFVCAGSFHEVSEAGEMVLSGAFVWGPAAIFFSVYFFGHLLRSKALWFDRICVNQMLFGN
eukprot:g31263.t1